MNIVLIGYRGTGKGAIGRVLAEELNFKFVDTDKLIIAASGMPIPEIFEKFGEGHFRKLETQAVKKACEEKNCVIATGGGSPMQKENAPLLKRNNLVILLKCSPETIYSRIKGDSNRPALTEINDEFKEIVFMLEKRNPAYNALADFVTDTSEKPVEKNVSEIVAFIKSRESEIL